MTTAANIREFLITRRPRLTPADAGLPDFGGRRRVPGLRREEVALLAGMSVEYYVRLERGNASGISDAILDGISRALKLDDAEHAHLYDLVRAANRGTRTPQRKPASRTQQIRPGMRQILDAMTFPAIIQNGSSEFAGLWEAHDVRIHLAGKKLFHHPDVGDLDLSYEAMQLMTDPGLQL